MNELFDICKSCNVGKEPDGFLIAMGRWLFNASIQDLEDLQTMVQAYMALMEYATKANRT